jgi:glycosyltransferase involved in cell wall biosynthesis
MIANKHVSLSILGAAQVSERLLALSNVSNYPLLPYNAMLTFIAKHDLMLVPLADDVFNRTKSGVKFVECGAVGVPVLASRVGEFDYLIDHEINGLLASSAEEFHTTLEKIVNMPKRLELFAYGANKTVKETYTTLVLEDSAVSLLR